VTCPSLTDTASPNSVPSDSMSCIQVLMIDQEPRMCRVSGHQHVKLAARIVGSKSDNARRIRFR
jgi:hypothetical protein